MMCRTSSAGLSQTDGYLASVSGTVFGKHMPRESSPPNACAVHTTHYGTTLRTSAQFYHIRLSHAVLVADSSSIIDTSCLLHAADPRCRNETWVDLDMYAS